MFSETTHNIIRNIHFDIVSDKKKKYRDYRANFYSNNPFRMENRPIARIEKKKKRPRAKRAKVARAKRERKGKGTCFGLYRGCSRGQLPVVVLKRKRERESG